LISKSILDRCFFKSGLQYIHMWINVKTIKFLKNHGLTTMSNLSLTKELKIYDGEIAASSTKTAGKTG
jgi:hypothetical protein